MAKVRMRLGPWRLWLEIKGPNTKVSRDQVAWWYEEMAAGGLVFCLRHPRELEAVYAEIGFPLQNLSFNILPDHLLREEDVQAAVRSALRTHGWGISDMSQGYRPGGKRHWTTRQRKGIPDMYVTHAPIVRRD